MPEGRTSSLERLAAHVREAVAAGQLTALLEHLDDDVTWADCIGREAVTRFVEAVLSEPIVVVDGQVEVADDRLIVSFATRPAEDPSAEGPGSVIAVFVGDGGRITEIVDVPDVAAARRVRPLGDLAVAAERRAGVDGVAPVLPVADLDRAVDHYRRLGAAVERYDGGAAYAFATIDRVELHLAEVADLDPVSNTSAVYLRVGDADALYARWRSAGVAGRLTAPVDTEYGQREGAHVDPDGNLLRFGSPSAG